MLAERYFRQCTYLATNRLWLIIVITYTVVRVEKGVNIQLRRFRMRFPNHPDDDGMTLVIRSVIING